MIGQGLFGRRADDAGESSEGCERWVEEGRMKDRVVWWGELKLRVKDGGGF